MRKIKFKSREEELLVKSKIYHNFFKALISTRNILLTILRKCDIATFFYVAWKFSSTFIHPTSDAMLHYIKIPWSYCTIILGILRLSMETRSISWGVKPRVTSSPQRSIFFGFDLMIFDLKVVRETQKGSLRSGGVHPCLR